jgi:hypothetical protein
VPTYSPDQHNAITAVQMALESLAQAMLRVRRTFVREEANLPEHTKHTGVALKDWIEAMPVYDCPAHLERVAVWVYPGSMDALCEKCAAKFVECDRCHEPAKIDEIVTVEDQHAVYQYHRECWPVQEEPICHD